MKKLMLAFVLFFTISLFAQDKINPVTLRSDQVNEWMKNIASDSSMRCQMMEMMMEKTMDNPQEMMLLVNIVLRNTEMHNMIKEIVTLKTDKYNKYLNMPGKLGESNDVMKMTGTKKKPIIKN